METNHNWFLHVDLDAFFASVEQLDNPSYRGKPVIVGGLPDDKRSVVSTASYEARKFGVHSAMPIFQAYKLCPQGIYIRGRMKRYAEISYKIMNIFRDFSPDVLQMSIDEAFIDLTGTEKLFGAPEETAMKIKARVKEETGLTVSIGLATTQYLAKIASGYSKPDGFYFVKPGEEESFMLNLPLEKVWGVGKKSLELLKSKGFKSTRSIYEADSQLLEFLFGKNMAGFLYDVVRGGKNEEFGGKAKSHSISAETTFNDDITDTYTAETAILELAQGVFFRLLREGGYSRTAMIKIRYGDFTTVSIQETEDRNILTLDSFFEILKRIFEKKYDTSKGIRLLGVALENIEKEEKPYQQYLFDDGTEKRQAVEKAILQMNKKHPEIKIQKARLLKCTALFFTLLMSGRNVKLNAAEINEITAKGAGAVLTAEPLPPLIVEAPVSLFDWNINDENKVEFLVSGYWQGEATAGVSASFGSSSPFATTFSLPIFKQTVDLSAWFLLNQKWYFEADFADEFTKNTLALGYNGEGTVKSTRISNRNITMSKNYSAQSLSYGLAGGENQAPGIMVTLGDSSSKNFWQGDFLFRYEMTKTKTATFYGKNSVTDLKIPVSNYLHSHQFVFPEEAENALQDILDIYLEDAKGEFVDQNRKKYKKLSASDYRVYALENLLVLNCKSSVNGIPTILVTFKSGDSISSIISATGDYSNSSSFAGRIQDYFAGYDLADYSYPLVNAIEGRSALVIQNTTGFSPFLCAAIYDCGVVSEGDVDVVSGSSEKSSSSYSASFENNLITYDDFFTDNHKYARIYNKNFSQENLQSPAARYPFADESPELYLNLPYSFDATLLLRNYSPVSNFDIGTKAIAGSVQVYVNNRLDAGAKYDSGTGYIELSSMPSQTDKVYIIWQEDSEDFSGGAIAAGAGVIFNFLPSLNGDFSITSRWPLSFNSNFASPSQTQTGFAAISSGIEYRSEHFSISDKSAIAFTNENATGTLLVSSNSQYTPETYYLSASDGYVTQTEPYLINYGIFLRQENNGTIKAHGGQTDSRITGYKIPLQWDFSDLSEGSQTWAAVDVKLSGASELKNSDFLEIAILPALNENELLNSGNFDVYLQLGISADSDFKGEDSTFIPLWKLTDFSDEVIFPLDLSKNEWQTVKIRISDEQRARLVSAFDARIIVLNKSDAAVRGKLYVGPYQPELQSAFTKHSDSLFVSTTTTLSTDSPSAKSLYKAENHSSKISWFNLNHESMFQNDNTVISTAKYFEPADFKNYSTINLDFSYEAESVTLLENKEKSTPDFTLILDENDSGFDSDGLQAAKVIIYNFSPYISYDSQKKWHTLTIDTKNKTVLIDDIELNKQDYSLYLNKSVIPNRLKLSFDTRTKNSICNKGNFYLDNLYYSSISPNLRGVNNLFTEYKNDFKYVKDVSVSFDSTQTAATPFNSFMQEGEQAVQSTASAGFTVAHIRLQSDLTASVDGDNDFRISEGGHLLKTQENLFRFANFGETFRFDESKTNITKTDFIQTDFSALGVPVLFGFTTTAQKQNNLQNQNASTDLNFTLKFTPFEIGWKNNLTARQKIITGQTSSEKTDYFTEYTDISQTAYSIGFENASLRNITFDSDLYVSIPFIKIKPEIRYQIISDYNNPSKLEKKYIDSTVLMNTIPLTFDKHQFAFTYTKKSAGSNINLTSANYIDDFESYFKSQAYKEWFYTSIPFYDLFDSVLPSAIGSSRIQNLIQELSYNSTYELSWKRKFSGTITDLFVPLSTTFAVSRIISNTDVLSDLYQLKTNLAFSSLNNFGVYSPIRIFKWYEQDEIIANLTGLVKIPADRPENTSFMTSAYLQTNFYIDDERMLTAASDLSLETDLNWSCKITGLYSRPGNTSLLTAIPKLFIKDKNNFTYKLIRKDSFNMEIGSADSYFKQKYEYLRSEDIKFKKYFTLTGSIGLSLSHTQTKAFNLGSTVTIGGKAEF